MAVERVREGERAADVIAAYGFNRTTIYKWLQLALQPGLGIKALHSSKATGRPRSLTPTQERRVFRWINGRDPRQYGLDFGLWTRNVVADLIEQKFGVRLGVSAVGELLAKLGPEPLTDAFDGDLLWRLSRGRTAAVKLFLMDNAVVVGVGNIYASEALFYAGIDPRKPSGSVSRARYARLAAEVKRLLAWAIERGGTTLRDFLNPDGAPGYFFRELMVYGRAGEPCRVCGTPIRQVVLGQRSTFWCPRCQR